jgi:hypothetical protein
MSHPNKVKGTGFERELVKEAQAIGLQAKRAWGSNGEAMGFTKEVDLLIEDVKLQAKRHKKLPAWLSMIGVDGVVFRENHGDTYVMITWNQYLSILKQLYIKT